jgi:hypothetical protein
MGEPGLEARSENQQSLAHMSSLVLSAVQAKPVTSCAEIADDILRVLSPRNPDAKGNQRTITRRVYDVLNVFAAAGLVSKTDAEVRFQPGAAPSRRVEINEQVRAAKSRIAVMEAALAERAQILIYYRLLIERNHGRPPPVPAFAMPVMFVGFRDIDQGQVKRVLDGSRLEIAARSAPIFFSPLTVFEKMRFGVDTRVRMLRRTPEIAALEPLLFPDASQPREARKTEEKEIFQIQLPR